MSVLFYWNVNPLFFKTLLLLLFIAGCADLTMADSDGQKMGCSN
ncbi:hypothetical protein [Membranihabitans marinus]|nr:hypothetical protein [Membranihabitans marinus]